MNGDYFEVKTLEVTQPIGTFYICKLSPEQITSISHTDVRRLEGKKRDVEEYIGLQRELSKNRVKELQKYVELVDASFPNTIILSISSHDAEYNQTSSTLRIRNEKHVGKVLDGQHRIAGLEGITTNKDCFDTIVAIFIDMELEDQAILFATINSTQTKVNKSLAIDLFAFATYRSPQKTCHNIARALDQLPSSPFHGKIKILGSANDKEKETITQATFVESLIKYISKDRMKDRDDIKRGKKLKLTSDKEFLRKLFIEERDKEIAQLLINYFSAVQNRWPEAWNKVTPEIILNKSTGFIALMRFLPECCKYLNYVYKEISISEFQEIFDSVNLSDSQFNRDQFIPGSSGQSALLKRLKEAIPET